MSHFKEQLTKIELFIEENFNYNDEEDNKFAIEDEGEFIQIKPPLKERDQDGD